MIVVIVAVSVGAVIAGAWTAFSSPGPDGVLEGLVLSIFGVIGLVVAQGLADYLHRD